MRRRFSAAFSINSRRRSKAESELERQAPVALATPPASPPLPSLPTVSTSSKRPHVTSRSTNHRESQRNDSVPRSTQQSDAQAKPFSSFEADCLTVSIVGGGIGGLSAAIACARMGYSVTVYERSSGLSRHGDALAIAPSAVKVLSRWGLFDEFHDVSANGGFWLVKDARGQTLHREDLRDYPARFGAPLLQGSRATYLGILGTEARLQGAEIRYGTEIVQYCDSAKSPSIVTAEGEHIFSDVIIAADGIRSRAQRMLTAPSLGTPLPTPDAVESGENPFFKTTHCVYRGMITSQDILANRRTAYLLDGNTRVWLGDRGSDAHLCVSSFNEGGNLSFTFECSDPSGTSSLDWRDRRPIEEVLDRIKGWDPSAYEAMRLFKTCLQWKVSEAPPVGQWISRGGRILLVGDAAHPLCPSSYSGGSQGIEDGATVALCLALSGGTASDVPRALKAFTKLRWARTAAAQQAGIEQCKSWQSYANSGRAPETLNLLVSEGFQHDCEEDTLKRFAGVVLGFDNVWSSDSRRKSAVLSKMEFHKTEAVPGGLFDGCQIPVV